VADAYKRWTDVAEEELHEMLAGLFEPVGQG
jgi:hypothetical protein